MTKTLAALLLLPLAANAFAASQTLDSILQATPRFEAAVPAAEPGLTQPPFEVLDAHARLLPQARALGDVVGQASLPAQLDKHKDLLPAYQLGPNNRWDISVAGDPGFKKFFVTFRRSGLLNIAPLGDLNRLRGEGIDITVEPGVVYNFKAKINIFNPVRGSTLQIHATQGTSGPNHDVNTGDLLDKIKEKAYVFSSDDNEYWMLHGTDVDPATNQQTNTTSLLFIHEAGLSTKAWPVAVGSIPVGGSLGVDFNGAKFALSRDAAGNLTIAKAD